MSRAWLPAALGLTTVLIAVAGSVQVLAAPPDAPPLPARLFGLLIAAAGADVAVLLRRRAPGVAWFATVAAAGISAVQLVGGLRDAGLVTDTGSAPVGLAMGLAALVTAATIGLLDAIRPRPGAGGGWERIAAVGVGLAVAATLASAAWTLLGQNGEPARVAAASPDDLAPFRLTGRLALLTVLLGAAVGAARDMHPGLGRAWARWSVKGEHRGAGRPPLLDVLAEELLPWRVARGAEARERERARLAADLHALVLPDLRRAAAMAESTAAATPVVDGVRRALDDVERLMHQRQSIVLEEFGLVAALEWLAERTEQHTGLHVNLELDGARVDARDAVRPDVARSAFRIALLALDNSARHANATTATLRLHAGDASGVRLEIADDGHGGLDVPAGTARDGSNGRGLADMRSEAAASGGSVRVEMRPSVTVEATWPA